MKKFLVVLGIAMAAFSFQASAATLAWVSQSSFGPSADFNSASHNGGQNLTADGTFNNGSTTAFQHIWTYSLDAAATVENIAIEFFDSQIAMRSVYLDGEQLTSSVLGSGNFSIRQWVYTGLLAQGTHKLMLNFASAVSGAQYDIKVNVAQTPVPAAAWLFGSALMGMTGIARRKKA